MGACQTSCNAPSDNVHDAKITVCLAETTAKTTSAEPCCCYLGKPQTSKAIFKRQNCVYGLFGPYRISAFVCSISVCFLVEVFILQLSHMLPAGFPSWPVASFLLQPLLRFVGTLPVEQGPVSVECSVDTTSSHGALFQIQGRPIILGVGNIQTGQQRAPPKPCHKFS